MRFVSWVCVCFLLFSIAGCAETLDERVRTVAQHALARFGAGGLTADKLAITVATLDGLPASYRGAEPIYPASVVKLFYLVALHAQMEAAKVTETPELTRAVRDMIVDSTNEATALVVDTLTGTTSGPELSGPAWEEWTAKRNWMNRYFSTLGYTGINVNQKTFSEGPYGRERQSRGPAFENNNRLTTDATARLLATIARKEAVSAARSQAMLALLKRDFTAPATDPDDQAHGFSGTGLPAGAHLWSKAGWTTTTRHDAAYVELPGGARYVAVIFTVDNAKQSAIIPSIAAELAEFFSRKK